MGWSLGVGEGREGGMGGDERKREGMERCKNTHTQINGHVLSSVCVYSAYKSSLSGVCLVRLQIAFTDASVT